VLEDMWTLAAW